MPVSGPPAIKEKKRPEEKHKDEIVAIMKALDIPPDQPITLAWLKFPGAENVYSLPGRAHRDNLARPRPVDQQLRNLWDDFQSILELVLKRFEANYLRAIAILDELLDKPTLAPSDINRLKQSVPNTYVNFAYFFEKLPNADSLPLLISAGFFSHPPDPEILENGIRFPVWPQSRCLFRLAPEAPGRVLEAALRIELNDNTRIHEDLVDAANNMPPLMAARIANRESAWLDSQKAPLFWVSPENIAQLINRLAIAGLVKPALQLTASCLSTFPPPNGTQKDGFPTLTEPLMKFDDWHYQQIIAKSLPQLVEADAMRALGVFCHLLDNAIRIAREERPGAYDRSVWWRPNVAGKGRRYAHGAQNALTTAVVEISEQMLKKDPLQTTAVVNFLSTGGWRGKNNGSVWHVFRRIALYLLHQWPAQAMDLVESQLLDSGLMASVSFQNEYSFLLRDTFQLLPAEAKGKWLTLIEHGPSSFVDDYGNDVSGNPEARVKYISNWRHRLLAPIATQLPAEWKTAHPDWVKGLAVPTDLRYVQVDDSVKSPWPNANAGKTSEPLPTFTPVELVQFLKGQLPGSSPAPSKTRALERATNTLSQIDPLGLVAEAEDFLKCDPRFARVFLSRLTEAVKQGSVFSWMPVLALCNGIAAMSNDAINAAETSGPADYTSWSLAKWAVMPLIAEGFVPKASQIPFSLRESVWKIIEQLAEETEPTREQEEGRDIEGLIILSMDSIRGQAMDGVLRYACWVYNAIDNSRPPAQVGGFDQMPEMRIILDRHLDMQHDPSLAVHSIYGSWFGVLHFLDSGWTSTNLRRIFPITAELHNYRRNAWYAFLTGAAHYERVFDVLSDDYHWALDQLGSTTTITEEELRHLGDHILMAYVRGKTSLDDPDSVINNFLAKAPTGVRAHAINSIGIDMAERGMRFEPDEITRIQALWTQRLEARGAGTAVEELAGFGWWFLGRQFPRDWAIQQLLRTLVICPKIEAAHLVAKELATLCPQWPAETLRCIELMIEEEEQAMWIYSFQDEAGVILHACLQSLDPAAQQAARDFINRLAARGHLMFRNLIPLNAMS